MANFLCDSLCVLNSLIQECSQRRMNLPERSKGLLICILFDTKVYHSYTPKCDSSSRVKTYPIPHLPDHHAQMLSIS